MIKESGIVERLRAGYGVGACLSGDAFFVQAIMRQAATLIAELQAERDRLNSELDASNKNHRSMAQQMAELQDKLERAEADLMHVTESFRCADVERDEMRDRALAAESSLHRVRGRTIEECAKIAERDSRSSLAVAHDYEPVWFQHGKHIASSIRSLNITGLDTGAVKTAESSHSPSTLNAETE